MSLALPGTPQLFDNAQRTNQGMGKERTGAFNFVVALDETGDFSDIQEAIDALPSIGGGIYIKEGTYDLVNKITINKSNVTLSGVGKATIIKSTANIEAIDYLISISSKSGITIRDISFDATAAGDVGCIECTTLTNSFIGYCWFIASGEASIHLKTNSNGNIFLQNRFTSGLAVESVGCSNNIYMGNVCTSTYAGIRLRSGSSNNVLSGNVSSSNTIDGIRIEAISAACDRNIVTGNICQSNGQRGIYVYNNGSTCNYNLVHGNICNLNTTAQITDSGTNTTVADNIQA